MTRGVLDARCAAWWGLADQKTPRPGRRNAAEPSRAHARSDFCRMNSPPAYWRSHMMSRLDSGNRPGRQRAGVAEAPTSSVRRPHPLTSRSRCTRFRRRAGVCDCSFGDGAARSAGAERAVAGRHARVCRYLASQARRHARLPSSWQAPCVRLRRRAEVHEVAIDSSSRGNRPSATTWVGHVRSRRCAWRSCQG